MGPTSSIVAGPPRATIETPWVAVVGPRTRRPHEVIVINDSESDSDGPPVIVLSDSESDDMFVSPRQTPPRVVNVGLPSVGVDPADDVYVGPVDDGVTLDGAFDSFVDVSPVVPNPVDEDVGDNKLVDVGPA